jgi:hypothetical protein
VHQARGAGGRGVQQPLQPVVGALSRLIGGLHLNLQFN